MKCEDIKTQLSDYVAGRLDPSAEKRVKNHLSGCRACQAEMQQLQTAWEALGRLPEEEPSPAMRNRFYAMLENEKAEARSKHRIPWRQRLEGAIGLLWPQRPTIQFALSLVFLAAGVVIGTFVQQRLHRNGEMTMLRQEVRDMRQMISVSLMNQSSSSERLRGVSFSTQVEQPTETLLSTLLSTLNSDPNVNVRLAAVDAMILFIDQPGMRDALVESLSKQTSPLVQIAIMDLLVQIKERSALVALQKLIQDQNIDQTVRLRAQESIKELI